MHVSQALKVKLLKSWILTERVLESLWRTRAVSDRCRSMSHQQCILLLRPYRNKTGNGERELFLREILLHQKTHSGDQTTSLHIMYSRQNAVHTALSGNFASGRMGSSI